MRKKKIISENNLKHFRLKKGLTLQELGDLLDENWQNIQRYENMQRDLTMAMAKKIAPYLDLEDPAMLFGSVKHLKESGNSESETLSQMSKPANPGSVIFPFNVFDLIPMYGAVSASSPELVHFTEDYMIEEVPRHPSVQKVKGAFAMQVAGDSMSPRHFPGERVYIHPHQIPSIGQDCVVVQEPDGNAILKQFRGETSTEWKFSQINPAKEFNIKKSKVRKIFAVVR